MWLNKIKRSNFLIRLRSWEYWPFLIIYWPVFFYWIWYSIKAKSFFYFSASNPTIENGGMLGESKIEILNRLPEKLIPITVLIKTDFSEEQLLTLIDPLQYPLICKPNIGERGRKVEKVNNQLELKKYHSTISESYIIQEFIDQQIELGVFYYRYPNQKFGVVSSIVQKEMLTLIGDGVSTVTQLILGYDRAKLQWDKLKLVHHDELSRILAKDEQFTLVEIGNHSRGTKFLNANHLINDQLNLIFDDISKTIPGFYFGRFDIKTSSVEDLNQGRMKIMELNGAGSEPAHIYDPNHSLLKAYHVILFHWKTLFEISMENHQNGTPFLSLKNAWKEYRKIRQLQKL